MPCPLLEIVVELHDLGPCYGVRDLSRGASHHVAYHNLTFSTLFCRLRVSSGDEWGDILSMLMGEMALQTPPRLFHKEWYKGHGHQPFVPARTMKLDQLPGFRPGSDMEFEEMAM